MSDAAFSFVEAATTDVVRVPVSTARLREGLDVDVRHLAAHETDWPLLILLHGSGWYGQQFDALLPVLTHHADVLAPDLCGHGPHAKAGGDLDYIGQLEDDIADLINLYARPGQKIVLAGHCSGGGLAIRFLAGVYGAGWHWRSYLRPFLSIIGRPCAPMLGAGRGRWYGGSSGFRC